MAVGITSSSFIIMEMEGTVKHIALWDTICPAAYCSSSSRKSMHIMYSMHQTGFCNGFYFLNG